MYFSTSLGPYLVIRQLDLVPSYNSVCKTACKGYAFSIYNNVIPFLPVPTGAQTQPVTPLPPTVPPPKAFKVEEDHNKYKCPFTECPKAFRKMSLVEYHIKYYHSDDGKTFQPPPAKKRKKTISICKQNAISFCFGCVFFYLRYM